MKIRSKILISLTAVIAILANMLVFAAEEPEKEAVGLYESNFLREIKVIDISESKLTGSVTNSEFAGAAAVIGGLTGDYYEDGLLERLVSAGYMPPDCMYAARPIKFIQAVKTLVTVLGYDDEASRNGGYPKGYIAAAGSMELLSGISASESDELTWGVLAKMLYNALECETVEKNGDSYSYSGATVLEAILHIYKAKGQVTANSITALTEPNRFREGSIQIDGEEFECSNNRFDGFFGYNVDYWYKQQDSGVSEILYMEANSSRNNILQLDYTSTPEISGGAVLYTYSQAKEKRAVIEAGCCIVYNGRVTGRPLSDFETLEPNTEITLVDTNVNGKYDVVIIREYKSLFVSKTTTYKNIVYDKYDSEKKFSFDSDEPDTRYIFKDTEDNDMKFSDIKTGTVLSVAMSEDGKIADTVLCRKTVEAAVKGYSDDGKWSVIRTDSDEFKAYASVGAHLYEMELGVSYTIYFDKFGIAAGFAKSTDTYMNAVLLKVYRKDGNPDDNANAEVRLYNMADKTLEILALEENVKVDGILRKKAEQTVKAITENTDSLKYRVIRYKLSDSGNIREVDTIHYDVQHESGESLHLLAENGAKSYERDSSFFYNSDGTGFVVDKTASKMFVYNITEPENSTEYSSVTAANLPIYTSLSSVAAYTTDIKNGIAEIVMIGLSNKELEQINGTIEQCILFDCISEVSDEGGEIKYCINGWDLLKNSKYTQVVEDVSNLSGNKSGDIVVLNITYSGRLGDTVTVYKADSGVTFNGAVNGNGSNTVTPTSYRWLWGKAYLSGNGFLYVVRDGRENTIDQMIPGNCDVVTLKKKSANYYIYDQTAQRLDKIQQTDFSEINDYVSGGECADNVLVYSRHSSNSIVIVFR